METFERLWPHFHSYIEINKFTLALLMVLGAVAVFSRILSAMPRKVGVFKAVLESRRGRLSILIIIALIGLGLRLGWLAICEYKPRFEWNPPGKVVHTLVEYDKDNIHAASIARGVWFHDDQGAPEARRLIGYPMFLGLFYFLFGPHTWVVYSLQLILFLCLVPIIYSLTKSMFEPGAALMASFICSLYPMSVYSSALTLAEHLFIPLWFFGIYLLFNEVEGRPVPGALLWYGLIFGYATMTRTHAIVMPVVVALAYGMRRYSWKKILMGFMVVFMLGQLINLPWVIRNYRQFGFPIIYLAGNRYLYSANNPKSRVTTEYYNQQASPLPGEPGYAEELHRAIERGDLKSTQKIALEETVKWIWQNPGDFTVLGIEKILHFLGIDRSRGVWAIDLAEEGLKMEPDKKLPEGFKHWAEEAQYTAYYVILFLFVMGIVRLWVIRKSLSTSNRHAILLMLCCFLLYLAQHFILYPERKYRFPLEIIMILFSSSFLTGLMGRFSLKQESP